ncbi:MAG: EpsD family peptidyl-prolyl cis-trans isomerase [Steroidobacteraceae bacterium]
MACESNTASGGARAPTWNVIVAATCAGMLMTALTGCSAKGTHGKNSQVVATVNDKEITATQLNRVLQSSGVSQVTPEVTRRALESLTSEELLVQAALEGKIDRDPAFVLAMEQSRRQLLAQFFAEKTVYPKATISADEVAKYYAAQPLLFANRKKFRLTTFVADKQDMTAAVNAEIEGVDSVEDVRTILDGHAIKYVTQMASVAPEQLPLAQLPAFQAAKVGDLFVSEQPSGKVTLMSVTAVEEDVPLTLERAKPLIETYLANARNKQAIEDYLQQSRAVAKITYVLNETHAPAGAATPAALADSSAVTPDAFKKGAAGLN